MSPRMLFTRGDHFVPPYAAVKLIAILLLLPIS
jgi:hypothetical protein